MICISFFVKSDRQCLEMAFYNIMILKKLKFVYLENR